MEKATKEVEGGGSAPAGGCVKRSNSIKGPTFRFDVERKGKTTHNFTVTLLLQSPTTMRRLKKTFTVPIAANTVNKDFWNINVVAGAVLSFFKDMSRAQLLATRSKRDLGGGVYRLLKKVTNRMNGKRLLDQFESDGKAYLVAGREGREEIPFIREEEEREGRRPPPEGEGEGGGEGDEAAAAAAGDDGDKVNPLTSATAAVLEKIAIPQPKESVFAPIDTGATYAMIGKSKSGKTTFLVDNLNALTTEEMNQYNAIIYFTKSPNANPLKDLKPEAKKRFIMVGRFCPKILLALKRINDETDLMFKFLVIFDDILQLRGALLTECILTLRNSNISTAISIQYEKLMSPAQRASVHNVYIFNLRTEQWEFFLKGFIVGNIKEIVPPLREVKRVWPVAQAMREVMNPYILYYDQVNDKTMFYRKYSDSAAAPPPEDNNNKDSTVAIYPHPP